MYQRSALWVSAISVPLCGGISAGQELTLDRGLRGALLDTSWIQSTPPFGSQSDGFFEEAPSQYEEWTVGASAQIIDASASLSHSSFATTSLFRADVAVSSSATANPGAYDIFTSLAVSSYQVDFTIDEAMDFLLEGEIYANQNASARIRILTLGGGGDAFDVLASNADISLGETLTLAAGSYSLRASADSSLFDTLVNAEGSSGFVFTFRAVPSPASAAIFLIAACTPCRRR